MQLLKIGSKFLKQSLFRTSIYQFSSDKNQPAIEVNPISEEYLRSLFRKIEKEKFEETIQQSDSERHKEKTSGADLIAVSPLEKLIYNEKIEFFDTEQTIIKTKYGNLRVMPSFLKKYNANFSNIYYISNHTKTNFIKKVFKEDKNALLLFVPDANYHNARNLFDSFVKKLAEFYFPKEKLIRDFKASEETTDKSAQIYHDTIRKMIDLRKFLSRIVIIVNSDFSLRNDQAPDLKQTLRNYFEITGVLPNGEIIRKKSEQRIFYERLPGPFDVRPKSK